MVERNVWYGNGYEPFEIAIDPKDSDLWAPLPKGPGGQGDD